jgi:hypothetical protein
MARLARPEAADSQRPALLGSAPGRSGGQLDNVSLASGTTASRSHFVLVPNPPSCWRMLATPDSPTSQASPRILFPTIPAKETSRRRWPDISAALPALVMREQVVVGGQRRFGWRVPAWAHPRRWYLSHARRSPALVPELAGRNEPVRAAYPHYSLFRVCPPLASCACNNALPMYYTSPPPLLPTTVSLSLCLPPTEICSHTDCLPRAPGPARHCPSWVAQHVAANREVRYSTTAV